MQDLLFSIKGTYAKSDRPVNFRSPQLIVYQWGTVQAGPAGNVVINIQHRAYVGSIDTLDIECHHRDMITKIIEAIEKRDPDLAEKRMRVHIEGLARYIEEKVEFQT